MEVNILFEGPEVDMANRNANLIKTVFISLAFTPFLPISPLIGIAGILIESYVFKFMLLRIHSRPVRHGDKLARQMFFWLEFGLLWFSITTLFCYWRIASNILYLLCGITGISFIYFLFPMKSWVRCCFKQNNKAAIIERLYTGDPEYDDYYHNLHRFYNVS